MTTVGGNQVRLMVLRIAALLGLLSVCARAALQAERGGFTEDDHHVLEVSQLGEGAIDCRFCYH